MKKLLVLMGLAAAAFSFTGCQKNEMKDADNDFKGLSGAELKEAISNFIQMRSTEGKKINYYHSHISAGCVGCGNDFILEFSAESGVYGARRIISESWGDTG